MKKQATSKIGDKMQGYVNTLVQTYQAQMAGAWPGCEQETLDKIAEIADNMNMSVEDVFDLCEEREPDFD